jgi:hypothetical protein
MKNITLSADEALIEGARRRARAENTTLNNLFRQWLERYAGAPRLSAEDVRRAAAIAGHFRAGGRFTRFSIQHSIFTGVILSPGGIP